MAKATLTLTDKEDGTGVTMEVDYGDAVDTNSVAHNMVNQLAESVLTSASSYTPVEDSAPEANVEPARIITPTHMN